MRKRNSAQQQVNTIKTIAQVLIVIILAMVVAGIINGAVFDTTRVSGRSMDTTLYGGKSGDAIYDSTHYDVISQNTAFDKFFFGNADIYGDKVILIKTKNVDRGDIIVFISDAFSKGEQWIKRVIGVEGDVIKIKDGDVYRNGELLKEDYVSAPTYPYRYPLITEETFTVGSGELFVMGDNRTGSTDSRVVGCIKKSSIVGRVAFVIKKDSKKIVSAKNL